MNIGSTTTQAFFVSLVALLGVIVLIALHDITAAAGLPIIAALGGAHLGVGAALSLPPGVPSPDAPVVAQAAPAVAPVAVIPVRPVDPAPPAA